MFVRLSPPQFSLALEAATVQLVDKSLLQQTQAPSALRGIGWANDPNTCRPQVMMLGPVVVEVASTRYVRANEDVGQRACCDGPRIGAVAETPAETPSLLVPGSQVGQAVVPCV